MVVVLLLFSILNFQTCCFGGFGFLILSKLKDFAGGWGIHPGPALSCFTPTCAPVFLLHHRSALERKTRSFPPPNPKDSFPVEASQRQRRGLGWGAEPASSSGRPRGNFGCQTLHSCIPTLLPALFSPIKIQHLSALNQSHTMCFNWGSGLQLPILIIRFQFSSSSCLLMSYFFHHRSMSINWRIVLQVRFPQAFGGNPLTICCIKSVNCFI